MAWVHNACHPLGLLSTGVIFLLEGIGVPIPVEIPLGLVTLRLRHCDSSYWEMVAVMWATTSVGNMIGYYMGYRGGSSLAERLLRWFRIKPATWHRLETWFGRHGLLVLIATRWINWGFAQNIWLSGITRMQLRRFLPVMLVNNFLWAMGWIWLSLFAVHFVGNRLHHFWDKVTLKVSLLSLAVILTGLALWWLWRKLRSARRQSEQSGE